LNFQTVSRQNWNRDKADGTTSSLNITNWEYINSFQIEAQYGGGAICYFIQNPATSSFELVHVVNSIDTSRISMCTDPAYQCIIYQEYTADTLALTTDDYIGMCFYSLFLEGTVMTPYDRFGYDASAIGVTLEQNILTLQCYVPYYNSANHDSIDIDILSVSSDGTKAVLIKLYRNCILTNPVFTPIYTDYIASSVDTVGVFGGLGTGIELFSFVLSKVDSTIINLHDLHTHIDPGSYLTITATSIANTDVTVSIGYHGK
jgi:hypothetical protein